jgi:lipopolysaccharide exporter
LQLPMKFVSISFSQVFFQKASEVCNTGGNVHALFRKMTLGLAALASIPTVLALLFAPPVFAWVLGAEWRTAGEYARWLVLWLAVMFTNLPANLCAQIYRKQRVLFCMDFALLACRAGSLVVGGLLMSAGQTILLFSVVGVVFNVVFIAWMWMVTLRNPRPGAVEGATA